MLIFLPTRVLNNIPMFPLHHSLGVLLSFHKNDNNLFSFWIAIIPRTFIVSIVTSFGPTGLFFFYCNCQFHIISFDFFISPLFVYSLPTCSSEPVFSFHTFPLFFQQKKSALLVDFFYFFIIT